ncbi:MAG: hypothetical protein RL660_2424 [Bacteroidota bacterium]|jgi:hypothetical protein
MDIVESFKKAEHAKMTWLDKLFRNHPVFLCAKDFELELKLKSIDKVFIVKPSLSTRFVALLFIFFGLLAWFTVFLVVFEQTLLPISVFFLLLVTAWIGYVVWTFFLNPKLSYRISMDKEKIIAGKQIFQWADVSDYMLMLKQGGKTTQEKLVLFIDNREVYVYNLSHLNKSGEEIMKRIEFYKDYIPSIDEQHRVKQ